MGHSSLPLYAVILAKPESPYFAFAVAFLFCHSLAKQRNLLLPFAFVVAFAFASEIGPGL